MNEREPINIVRGYEVIDNWGRLKRLTNVELISIFNSSREQSDDFHFYDEYGNRYDIDDLEKHGVIFKGQRFIKEAELAEPTIEDMKAELARYQKDVAKWTDLYMQYTSAGNKSAAYAKHEADNANRNVEFIKRQLKKIMENNRVQQVVKEALKDTPINEGKKEDKQKFLDDFYAHEGLDNAGWRRWVLKSIKKFGKDITGYEDKAWIKKQTEKLKESTDSISYELTPLGLQNLQEFLAMDIKNNKFYNLEMIESNPYTQLGYFMSLLDEFGGVSIDAEGFQFLAEEDPDALKAMIKLKLVQKTNTMKKITEAEGVDTAAKADDTFKTLEAILLDLRNAESKLVMGISYDMQNLFGDDLNAIKGVIENASASVENLAKKMHQQLLQEGKSNQSAADKFGDWFTENKF